MPFLAIAGIELVLFVVAMAGLLVLMAGHVPLRHLKGVFGLIPGIGGALAGGIDAFTGTVVRSLAPAYDKLVHPVAQWLWAYAMGPWHLAWNVVQSVIDAKQWAVRADQHAAAAEAAAEAFAAATVAGIQQDLQLAESAILGQMAADLQSAEFYAAQAAAGAEAAAIGQIGDLRTTLGQDVAGIDATINDRVATLNGTIAGVKSDVLSEANRLFGEAEAGVRALQGEVAGIPAEILGTIDQVVPGDIARALAAAGVAALPGLLSRTATLEAEATRCLEPLCDTITPNAGRLGNLGNLFHNLELLGVEAAILALGAECLTHPAAVVEDVSSVVNAVGGPVVSGVRDLLGG